MPGFLPCASMRPGSITGLGAFLGGKSHISGLGIVLSIDTGGQPSYVTTPFISGVGFWDPAGLPPARC